MRRNFDRRVDVGAPIEDPRRDRRLASLLAT
jgi:polyphosphate kinase